MPMKQLSETATLAALEAQGANRRVCQEKVSFGMCEHKILHTFIFIHKEQTKGIAKVILVAFRFAL